MRGRQRVRRGAGVLGLMIAGAIVVAVPGGPVAAQSRAPRVVRPVPGPVVPPPSYRRALVAGTRSAEGRPGAAYWRNHASYVIHAQLDPATARITGSETIRYINRSPDTLGVLALHVYLNVHRAGTVRNEEQEITGGVTLLRVVVDGDAVTAGSLNQPGRWQTEATLLYVRPHRPLLPGATVTLEIDWEQTFPQSVSGRAGHSDREVYFVGYWFPKMAVYDDLIGWDAEPFLGAAEFNDEFGDYDVTLEVPVGWTVMATGTLTNPTEVWTDETRSRLSAAALADSVVALATVDDRAAGRVTLAPAAGRLSYRFVADNVRDFAWTASDVQRWDATSARVPDRDGDGSDDRVLIHAFWREDRAPLWAQQASYAKESIEQHSRYVGLAYPWPHMTSVEGAGVIGSGMEFPMLTLIGSYRGQVPRSLLAVTAHELGHMWIPMIVGPNEARHAWMDEGTTSFLENEALAQLRPGDQAHDVEREGYLRAARTEAEQPLMTHGDYYMPGPAYVTASYRKPATLLFTLRGLIGAETFDRGLRAFFTEWAFKHPTPWDLFATFERVAGEDLDWFWSSFYYETWVLDQAVGEVTSREGAPVVVIEDRGFAPMPALVRIVTSQGGTLERTIPVDTWLTGVNRAELELPASVGEVTRVEIDPDHLFPDAQRADNVWAAR